VPPLEKEHQLVEEATNSRRVIPLDRDLISTDMDRGLAKGGLDEAEQLIVLAKETNHEVVVRNGDLDLSGRHNVPVPQASRTVLAASPGRPGHSAAAKEVHVEVGDGAPTVTADIEHEAIAGLGNAL
jgi:hypothetical protein